jgi:hypothetical protein
MAVLDTAIFFVAGKEMPASSAGMMRRKKLGIRNAKAD